MASDAAAPTPQEGGKHSADDAKITLYWLEKSRSQRILWLLEELALPYDLKTFKRQDMLAPPELKQIHPLGKSPIITIESAASAGNNMPLVLAESSFIVEYLTDHFGTWLAPSKWRDGMEGKVGGETEAWLRYRHFMHYAEGSLMPFLVISGIMMNIRTRSPFFIKPITNMITNAVDSKFASPNLTNNLSFLESQLATSPDDGSFLCGKQLTGADIMMSFPLGAARGRLPAFTKEQFPKLWEYVDRLEGRAAYKKAVDKIVEIEGQYEIA